MRRFSLLPLLVALLFSVEVKADGFNRVFERGEALFREGRWADARHEFLRARAEIGEAERSEMEGVDYYLAICAVELGRPDAETALKLYEYKYPGSLRTNDIRFALASYYCTQGEYELARQNFDKLDYNALGVDNRTKFDIRRGYLSFVAERYDEAYEYFKRVQERSAYADHALYYISYIEYTRGNYQSARRGFEKLMKSDAYRAVAPFYLLQLEFRDGNYTTVVEQGAELMKSASPSHQRDLNRMISESWFHLNDYNRALYYIRAYGEMTERVTREDAYIEGFSLYRLARYDEAVESLRKACGADDALTQNAAYHLADCYLRQGKKQEAMQSFAMATNRESGEEIAEDALYNNAKLQYELGGGYFGEAINLLSRYLKEYPESERREEVQTLLAAAYYNSDDYDSAYDAIKSLESPDADMRAALQKITYFRALLRFDEGELKSAAANLKESRDIAVSARYSSLADFWLGEIALIEGNYSSAKSLFNRFLQRAPKGEREYALAHYNLGYAEFSTKSMESAERNFDRFLKLYTVEDIYRADAQNRRADALYTLRRFECALDCYKDAARSSTSPRYYAEYRQALTLGVLERVDEKISLLKRIVASDRGDYVADASYELGRTYVQRGDYALGAKCLESFVQRYPNSPHYTVALSDLGLVHANLGNEHRSLEYYRRVVKAAPRSAEARDAVAGIRDIYMSRGDMEGYFEYAEESGIEADLTERSRDSLSFASARMLYAERRLSDAARSLRSYVKSFPSGGYLAEALYYLSDCYREEGNTKEEITTLESLANMGRTEYEVDTWQRLSELYFDSERYVASARAYRKLYEIQSSEESRRDALDGYLEAALKSGNRDVIIEVADLMESSGVAREKSLRRALFAKAKLAATMQEALKIYERLSSEVKSEIGAESMYRVIESHYKSKRMAEAEELIYRFAEMPSPRNNWLARAFILLGDIYLSRGDTFQARATYQSVVDGYSAKDDGIVEEARQRIANLKE